MKVKMSRFSWVKFTRHRVVIFFLLKKNTNKRIKLEKNIVVYRSYCFYHILFNKICLTYLQYSWLLHIKLLVFVREGGKDESEDSTAGGKGLYLIQNEIHKNYRIGENNQTSLDKTQSTFEDELAQDCKTQGDYKGSKQGG